MEAGRCSMEEQFVPSVCASGRRGGIKEEMEVKRNMQNSTDMIQKLKLELKTGLPQSHIHDVFLHIIG
jgi:hypothetical protein